jgi:hypothetical protein
MAKTIKDLCDVFQMEYEEKHSEAPSRGENSAAAKAAGGIVPSFESNFRQNTAV